jgi:hypothetical protein
MAPASAASEDAARGWLLLFHQIPTTPSYLRVKTWRRLQAVGALSLKNSVYVLPQNEQSHEHFQWMRREIIAGGGEATIAEARFVDGLTDGQLEALFSDARDSDWKDLADEATALRDSMARAAKRKSRAVDDEALRGFETQLARLEKRRGEIAAIDFFDARGREPVDALLEEVTASIQKNRPSIAAPCTRLLEPLPRGATWVTRVGIHVDRIASAWLIRRFIDRDARFKFVPPKGYVPEQSELRFDMYEAEFTHEGSMCTFEVLLTRAKLDDPALRAIGEIVHDLDIRDDAYSRPETAGVRAAINGLCIHVRDDEARLRAGSMLFDSYHAFFSNSR